MAKNPADRIELEVPSSATEAQLNPTPGSLVGLTAVFRLSGVDCAAIITADHGEGVVSLTVFPFGQPQLVRNHVTPQRLRDQENTWRFPS